jgi:hypothetical protein
MPQPRTFDVRPSLDPRNDAYPVQAMLGIGSHLPRRPQVWQTAPVTNQGAEGACIGHGWTAEARAWPVPVDLTRVAAPLAKGWPRDPDGFARRLYTEAQRRDPWPGEAPAYSGTTVLAGAKAMQALGLIQRYHWTHDVEDLIDALIAHGPAVLSVDWRDQMYDAPGGRLDVAGISVGRHCILANGYTPDSGLWGGHDEAIMLTNSWGPEWGEQGQAWVRKADLRNILGPHGEVCVPDSRGLGTSAPVGGVAGTLSGVLGRVKGWLHR